MSRGRRLEYFTIGYNSLEGMTSIVAGLIAGSNESSAMLIRHVPPERSIAGIVIAAISVIVMPLLARAKRRVASQLGSEAMHADSKQADFCSYLSAILLGGLVLNALVGWWWMDPVAGPVMVLTIGKEGISGLRAEVCCDRCELP